LREATDLQIAFLQSPDSLKDLVAFLELSRVDKGTEFLEIAHQAATLTAADHPFLPPPRPTPRQQMWRMLHESAIKPWQHEHWLFPKNPRFAEKAGPILDLYAGMWEGESLGRTTYVLSMDEKTSIQARGRRHEETPPQPKQTRRIEAEYKRNGALQYLAAWDVHRGIVVGRCEKKTGIKPFGPLVDQVLEQDLYKDATQLFFIVDNGSSHRGQASVERMRRRDRRIVLVHTPIHASWLNQVEIYFSIIQREVLTPNDFAKLERSACAWRYTRS
jgi:DDE superfamily endonuclease